MAGFDYSEGKSRNMLAAEAAGMITIGRWARQYGVSAAAATYVMRPREAHHAGTGRRGTTRLVPMISGDTVPTEEQLAQMKAFDAGDRPAIQGWYVAWRRETGAYGKVKFVPTLAVYRGDVRDAPRGLRPILDDGDFERAAALAGRDLVPFASKWDQVK